MEKNISVKELSERTKIPKKTIYSWLDGPRVPRDIIRLKILCNYLEVTIDEILFSEKPHFAQKIIVNGSRLEILFTCKE